MYKFLALLSQISFTPSPLSSHPCPYLPCNLSSLPPFHPRSCNAEWGDGGAGGCSGRSDGGAGGSSERGDRRGSAHTHIFTIQYLVIKTAVLLMENIVCSLGQK